MRRAIGWAAAIALLLVPAAAPAATFHVDPAGDDAADGTTPARAWRTVARVNRAALRPGDTVLLRGGRTHGGAALIPRSSGTRRAPIRFGSYGGGQARLTRGIYLESVAWLVIRDLQLRETGVSTSPRGRGTAAITLAGSTLTDVGIAVNLAHPGDVGWQIRGNWIARTRDSGLLLLGGGSTVADNTILATGLDAAIPYDRHGIYSKGPGVRIVGNRILQSHSQGVSTRGRDAIVAGNVIRGAAGGVGYFPDDPRAGLTTICANTMADVGFGVYVAPRGRVVPAGERFRIFGNTVAVRPGGAPFDVAAGGAGVTLSGAVATRPGRAPLLRNTAACARPPAR